MVDRPFVNIMFAVLLADDSTHLADGLHTADQVLLQSHVITSKIECVVIQERIQFRYLR